MGRAVATSGQIFRRFLLPAVILQSVVMGGGYATGREIVSYGAKYGANGWFSVAAIFLGFSVVAILTFEVARMSRSYNYKAFVEVLIGPFWPLFDILYFCMTVLVIAVLISAATEVLEATLGIPPTVGTLGTVVIVAALLYAGAQVIELFKTVGSGLLYAAYGFFAVFVLASRWPHAVEVFSTGNTSFVVQAGIWPAVGSGILYVGYSLVVFPAVLFSLRHQENRRESVVGGILAGALMTIPFGVTFLCIVGFYPDSDVLAAPVPWLNMLESLHIPALLAVFGFVFGWTLLETSVGLVHALVARIDEAALADRNSQSRAGNNWMSGWHKALIGIAVLGGGAILSKVGIVQLVADGYRFMAYAFLVVFGLPLVTKGLGIVLTGKGVRKAGASD